MAKLPVFKVNVNQLRPGVFIKLDVPWYKHPFLINRFKITKQDQIDILKELEIQSVYCIPDKSDALPLKPGEDIQQGGSGEGDVKNMVQELWKRKSERLERYRRQKKEYSQCETMFNNTVIAIQKVMKNLRPEDSALPAGAELVVTDLVESLMSTGETVVRLVNVQADREDLYQHTVNVTVLSLMLGKELGLDNEELRLLGLGAVFHDVGKQRIPRKVLCKKTPLMKNELEVIKLHARFGDEMVGKIQDFPQESRRIVRSHHEKLDGSGYPDHPPAEELSQFVRIVSIANSFDSYCNGENLKKPLTPYQALGFMFKNEAGKYDKQILSVFIRSLGVYPPGTLVALNNGAIGLVVATSNNNPLCPSLILYDAEVPRNEAVIFNMEDDEDVKILKSLLPSELPPNVRDYLLPQNNMRYFIDSAPNF